jgi:hypothetical protein
MKFPFVFLVLDALMVFGYGLALLANLARRFFRRGTNSKPGFERMG